MTFCQIRGRDCFLSVCDEGLCWWRGCQIATEKTESGPVSPLPLFSLLSSPAMARRLSSSQTVFHPGVLKTTHFLTFYVFISFTKKITNKQNIFFINCFKISFYPLYTSYWPTKDLQSFSRDINTRPEQSIGGQNNHSKRHYCGKGKQGGKRKVKLCSWWWRCIFLWWQGTLSFLTNAIIGIKRPALIYIRWLFTVTPFKKHETMRRINLKIFHSFRLQYRVQLDLQLIGSSPDLQRWLI